MGDAKTATEPKLAATVLNRHDGDAKAYLAGLIAGGATPENLFYAGVRAGIYTAGYERGMAAALGAAPKPEAK